MSTKLPSAVVFDWDNTLVDSWDAIQAAMNAALAAFEMPAWSLSEVKERCKFAAKDYFPQLFGENWSRAFDIYYSAFTERRAEHAARALPGSGELLRWLRGKQIPLFVVSNKRGDFLRQECAALEWTDLFRALVGATDTPESKPSRVPVDFALQGEGLQSSPSVWFVGDTDVDVTCAKNANCTPVFLGAPETGEALGVQQIFADNFELLAFLETL